MALTFSSVRHEALREYLVDKRKKSGLRQVDLAKLLKRNQSYVTNLERGQKVVEVVELRQCGESRSSGESTPPRRGQSIRVLEAALRKRCRLP